VRSLLSGWWLEPPLVPSPDDARNALRLELARPEYHNTNVIQRVVAWLQRTVQNGLDAASRSSPAEAIAAMVVLLALVALVFWMVSRTRRTQRAAERQSGVLTDVAVSAAELRSRAELALAEGRAAEAVVDGFRALALRQVERGRLQDVPGATAHEVALSLEATYPVQSSQVDQSAALFEAVLYGGHGASADQAIALLRLDDELAGAR
jgi:hypothetical protein